MQMPQIRLQSSFAQIELKTTKPVQSIEQPQATLDLQQPKAEMTINRTPAKLTIDQTKARADVDLKHISQRIQEAAQQGRKDLLEGIARRSHEGDDLMRIENGGSPIAQHAKRNSEGSEKQFNIGWIPSAGGVQIDYDPGKVEIDWKRNKPINNSKMNKPIIQYTPGSVEVALKQYNSLKIDFDNLKHVGINYEQLI